MAPAKLRTHVKACVDRGAQWLGPHRLPTGGPRLWVLMYHRILPKSDPRYGREEPGMVVQPATFAMHLRLLTEHFELLHLSEWLERYRQGRSLPRRACALTFDDGWPDNYEFALPLLEKFRVPATLFAVSHLIGINGNFWPNRVAALLRDDPQPERLPWLRPHLQGMAQGMVHPPNRDAVATVIGSLKAHSDRDIVRWLDESGIPQDPGARLMDWRQLRAMRSSGLVEVGSHTRHHYRLQGDLDEQTLHREIVESQETLERELNQPVSLFCYPDGHHCEAARTLVARYYRGAVTTRRGINSRGLQRHALLRIGIHEDRCHSEARFLSRLANWY